jgi:threonine dehydrogenase-like Zn-dependent dehydrogenase
VSPNAQARKNHDGLFPGHGPVRPQPDLAGGPAPVRAYIEELMPEILDGRLQPGRVFDRTITLDQIPGGYRAMDQRQPSRFSSGPDQNGTDHERLDR